MTKQADILSDFVDSNTISALSDFLDKTDSFESAADLIAVAFGATNGFSKIDDSGAVKLVSSFKNNLTLLIQKTWVEKSDIALKDQLLYQLNEFHTKNTWKDDYANFLNIINQAVFLMFGQNLVVYLQPSKRTRLVRAEMSPCHDDWNVLPCKLLGSVYGLKINMHKTARRERKACLSDGRTEKRGVECRGKSHRLQTRGNSCGK